MNILNQEVIKELTEMKKIGMKVPAKAFKMAEKDLSDYDNMSVSEIADLIIDLS